MTASARGLDGCIIVGLDATTAGEGDVRRLFDAGVRNLDPEQAVFETMLTGWATQQRARQLKASTVQSRAYLVRRFAAYSNDYPWQWTSTEAEEFFASLRTSPSTIRSHQAALRLFMAYLVDPGYEWLNEPVHWGARVQRPPNAMRWC